MIGIVFRIIWKVIKDSYLNSTWRAGINFENFPPARPAFHLTEVDLKILGLEKVKRVGNIEKRIL